MSSRETSETTRKLGIDDAYAVKTPADNLALYRDWAATYETDFTGARGYTYHLRVAEVFAREQSDRTAPVLDVGCGTGILGVELARLGFASIDGIDITPEMLELAEPKGAYRSLTIADVTKPLPIEPATYSGVVSVGAFTIGHIGPEPLGELVNVAVSGAVFAIGVNAEHYESRGFEGFLNRLNDSGRISGIGFDEVRIYENADDEHADDLALVVTFRTH